VSLRSPEPLRKIPCPEGMKSLYFTVKNLHEKKDHLEITAREVSEAAFLSFPRWSMGTKNLDDPDRKIIRQDLQD
jgi:hypothetical protein